MTDEVRVIFSNKTFVVALYLKEFQVLKRGKKIYNIFVDN